MTLSSSLVAALLITQATLTPGNHTRTLKVGGQNRSYLVHVPAKYDGKTPVPVVLALHGAAMNGPMMAVFCGLNPKADAAGFIAVYPSGTGAGPLLLWNAGGFADKDRPDDVAFIRALLDDLGSVAKVDPKRVYATGMSNGGMMCYRLAAELSDRIAAVAPVAGTMAIAKASPKRPVPVMHFHGTADALIPFDGPRKTRANSSPSSPWTTRSGPGRSSTDVTKSPPSPICPSEPTTAPRLSARLLGGGRTGPKWSSS